MANKFSVREVLDLLEDDDFGLSESESEEDEDGRVYCYSGEPSIVAEEIAATEEVSLSDGSDTEEIYSEYSYGNGSEGEVSSEDMDVFLSSKHC